MTPTLFQRALKREVLATPPVWLMRQAGRYHQHYQTLKLRHSFMELCKDPDLAAEVAMGPIRDFDFDVAILFSDLLFPLEMLGMPLSYNPGPQLGWNLETLAQIKNFESTGRALAGLEFQGEAMKRTRNILPKDKSLIGFVGGPWTLFVYAVEGSHKGGLLKSTENPELYQAFTERMVPLLQKNIELQLNAGAEVVMIFDTASGEVSPVFFATYLLPHLKMLANSRVGYYMKGGTADHYRTLAGTPFAGLGYDHRFNLAAVLKDSQPGFVQGNFHQNHLTGTLEQFEKSFEAYAAPLLALTPAERAGWVAGLGHGVIPQAKETNVKRYVQLVRETFR